MKTNIFCFVAGLIVASVLWGTINYSLHRPQDYTRNWPAWQREAIIEDGSGSQWMQNAYGRRLNGYTIYAPADASNASTHLNSPAFGGIMFTDDDADGKIETILLADAANRTFSFDDDNGDGQFDAYEYTTGYDPDSVTLRDDNLDGQFDSRFTLGSNWAVYLDGSWHEVRVEEKQHFVDLDGRRTRVEVWPQVRIISDDEDTTADE